MLWILSLMLLIVLVFIAAIRVMRGQDKDDDDTGRYPSPGIYRRQHVNHLRHH